MIDEALRILPGPVVLAAAAWFGLSYAAVGPEIGRRMGDLTYRPQCIAAVEQLQHAQRAEKSRQDQLREHRMLAREGVEKMRALIPPAMRGYLDLLPSADELLPPVPEQGAPHPGPAMGERASYCGCVVSHAVASSRLEFALYTASLGTYEPGRLGAFSRVMAGVVQDQACGPVPARVGGR